MRRIGGVFKIAATNLLRRPARTIFTMLGIALAIAILTALWGVGQGYQDSLQSDVDKLGFHVLVTAKGCPYEAATLLMKGGGGLRYMEQDVVDQIISDPAVERAAPQLMAVEYNPSKQGFDYYVGVDSATWEMRPWMKFKEGGWFTQPDAMEAVMGYEAAELDQRRVGDEILMKDGTTIKVVGVLERIGSQDDGTTFMPLATVQRLFHQPNKLSGIGIKLKDIRELPAFEERMFNLPGTQVVSMAAVKGTIMGLVSSAQVMLLAIAAIALIVAIFGVANSIAMSVLERTGEIGILRSLGAGAGDIFLLVVFESVLLAIIGGIVGVLLTLGGSSLVESLARSALAYSPTGSLINITPEMIAYALLGGALVGLLAGAFPAWRASRLPVVKAIHRND
jgi:putative ABC transport system permease protein